MAGVVWDGKWLLDGGLGGLLVVGFGISLYGLLVGLGDFLVGLGLSLCGGLVIWLGFRLSGMLVGFGRSLFGGLVVAMLLGLGKNTNFGFGPEWQCTPMPKGDPICVRLIAKDEAK